MKETGVSNYKKTKTACYLGFITQAIAANFTPLLFLKFHSDYNIPLGTIALIATVFYFTQLCVDLFCSKYVDKIGYRVCIVASEIFSAVGLVLLAFLPDLLENHFVGIIIPVIIYALGSGLIEVLCSPIIEACPFENKAATMSLLHSFYCWGSVGTILISTIFFTIFGLDSWKVLACLWAIIPAVNVYNFMVCPIENLVEDGKGMSAKALFKTPLFWCSILLMVCAGASEISMSQWASAYAESALGITKSLGDLLGPCLFATAQGLCRLLYGKYGEKLELTKFMIVSGILCLACYLLASLSNSSMLGLIGCIVCGFSVGIMWPGTISISTKKFPTGCTAMFALLAMAGDLGGSIGPGLVGEIAGLFNDNLRVGMGFACIFPIMLIISTILIRRSK